MSNQTKALIQTREMKMTWTLLLISLCYLVCVGPITIMNITDPMANNLELNLAFFCIYWLQYTLNFFIYAMRSEQFRTAYADFLYRTWDMIRWTGFFFFFFFSRPDIYCFCKAFQRVIVKDDKRSHLVRAFT